MAQGTRGGGRVSSTVEPIHLASSYQVNLAMAIYPALPANLRRTNAKIARACLHISLKTATQATQQTKILK